MAPPGSWWELRTSPPQHEVARQRPSPRVGQWRAGWPGALVSSLSFPPRAGLVTGEAGPACLRGVKVDLRTPALHRAASS